MQIKLNEYPTLQALLSSLSWGVEEVQTCESYSSRIVFDIPLADVNMLLVKVFPNDLPQDLVGTWMSNWIDLYRHVPDWPRVRILTKVERKARLVEEIYYEPIKSDQHED